MFGVFSARNPHPDAMHKAPAPLQPAAANPTLLREALEAALGRFGLRLGLGLGFRVSGCGYECASCEICTRTKCS